VAPPHEFVEHPGSEPWAFDLETRPEVVLGPPPSVSRTFALLPTSSVRLSYPGAQAGSYSLKRERVSFFTPFPLEVTT
jgi:hypothetical protein